MASEGIDKTCENCVFFFKFIAQYPCNECEDEDKWEPAGSDLVHG